MFLGVWYCKQRVEVTFKSDSITTNKASLISVLNPLNFYWLYRKQQKTKKKWKFFVYLRKIHGIKTKIDVATGSNTPFLSRNTDVATGCYAFKYTFSFSKTWVSDSSMGSNWQGLYSNTWHWQHILMYFTILQVETKSNINWK